jgi:excisionase family DNA binding protein
MKLGDPLPGSPWLNIVDACLYARVGSHILYRAIAEGKLRAARVDGRRKLVVKREWLDAWLTGVAPELNAVHSPQPLAPKGTRPPVAHPRSALQDQDRIAMEIIEQAAKKRG